MRDIASRLLLLAAMAALPACSIASAENVHQHVHQSVGAAGVTMVIVSNVSGPAEVDAGAGNAVVVDAQIRGSSDDDVARTHVVVRRNGNTISVQTKYDSGGSWFHNGGADVAYKIRVPRAVSLSVSNVSGDVAIAGVDGNVHATTVSGAIDAAIGRVAGDRDIYANAVSGDITLHVARNSDAAFSYGSVSGDASAFFPLHTDDGPGHSSASGRLGNGSARIRTSTVSGDLRLLPQ